MSNINRFLEAHENNYLIALSEVKKGRKMSHWMWYIFPQIKGLGYSIISQKYAIKDINEAKLYMENDILRKNMLEICNALLDLESNDILYIMGYPDDLKLKSSMTLFSISNPEIDVFQKVLDKYYNGEKDFMTETILNKK